MMIHHQDEREMTLIFLDSVVIVLICIWLEITLIIYHEDKENWHKNFTVMKHEHSLSSHKKWLYEEGKYFTDFFGVDWRIWVPIVMFVTTAVSVCTCIFLRQFLDPGLYVVLKFLLIGNHHILCRYASIFDLKADVTSHTTLYYGGSIVLFTTADW